MSLIHAVSNDFARVPASSLDNGDPLPALVATPVYGLATAARAPLLDPAVDFLPWPATVSLGSVDGTNGFKITGEDGTGWAVGGGGDFNGDGFSDVAVSAISASPHGIYDAGTIYVVFGNSTGVASTFDQSALDGNNGFRIFGTYNSSQIGISLSLSGDINGDGFADILVGSPYSSDGLHEPGTTYVIFGRTGKMSDIDLSTLNGVNGFSIVGIDDGSLGHAGVSVSNVGDVNGDGFDDIVIGANRVPNATYRGQAFVVFGSAQGFGATVNVSALNGTNGFTIEGHATHDDTGVGVAGIGDINGDGIDDVAIGAPDVTPNGSALDAGAVYIVFGHTGAFTSDLDPTTLNGTNGFKLSGTTQYNSVGFSVAAAGDVNGDGIADFIVGAPTFQKVGAAYVVFGTSGSFPANLDVTSLNGTNGFRLTGANLYDGTAFSVSSAGDINGDGFDDVLVSASSADPGGNSMAGVTYVVFGKASGFSAAMSLGSLDGNNGFALIGVNADDSAGQTVSAAGDLNNDGFGDLIVGAPGAQTGYVIYGRAPTGAVNLTGTAASQTLAGGNLNDVLSGMDGNDQLYGNGGHDILTGGNGADTFHLSSAAPADTDTINDYTAFDGDILDLTGLLDPHAVAAHLSDYVKFVVTNVNDLTLQVDLDGTGSGLGFADVATLTGAASQTPIVKVGNEIFHIGSSGNDHVVGAPTGDQLFDLHAGGDDSVTGGAGNDGFVFGATLTDLDFVDGGDGNNDQIAVQGDYSAGLLLTGSSIVNVEALAMLPGFNYAFTTDDSFVTPGHTFTFWSASMASTNHVVLDGGAESDGGRFNFYLGAGADFATGGNGADLFYGGDGGDTLRGNGGADTFAYLTVSNSTSTTYDSIQDFAAGTDKFKLPVAVGGVDPTIAFGTLHTASFDSDLTTATLGLGLNANHAVLFTPSAGDYNGHTFLIVDVNGTAGYQASADFVFDVTGITGTLAPSDFI